MNLYKTNEQKDVKCLSQLFYFMSHDLQQHSYRVAQYTGILCLKAIELGYQGDVAGILSEEQLPHIQKAALYHDIGKLMTPTLILNKTEPLDEDEWAVIKRHPLEGTTLLEKLKTGNACDPLDGDAFYAMARSAILSHHEWWNGRGYPYGFKRDEIPLIARICSIADAYDAITVNRAYQPAMPHEFACGLIEKVSGEQFDPDLIKVFRHCKDQFEDFLGKPAQDNLSDNAVGFALI
jgi:HD-GYP domain-containing protein (c-di-GMP phosphodiesterase class II)